MVKSIRYLKSAVFAKDFPMDKKPEIAIAGRSNAGKSSYINSLAENASDKSNKRKKDFFAKVSQTPGKTRLLNFFEVGEHYRLVDMPGYGFASRSGDEIREWQEMIENYISGRESMVGLLLVMDIRRDWTEDESMLHHFMNKIGKPMVLVLTKADKLKESEIRKRTAELRKSSGVTFLFPVSATKHFGTEDVENHVFKSWVKPYQEDLNG